MLFSSAALLQNNSRLNTTLRSQARNAKLLSYGRPPSFQTLINNVSCIKELPGLKELLTLRCIHFVSVKSQSDLAIVY